MTDPTALVAAWLVTYLSHSTLLYGAAWGASRIRVLRSPSAREHAWRAAMVGALLTSVIQSAGLVPRPPTPGWLPGPGLAAVVKAGAETDRPAEAPSATPGILPSALPASTRAGSPADSPTGSAAGSLAGSTVPPAIAPAAAPAVAPVTASVTTSATASATASAIASAIAAAWTTWLPLLWLVGALIAVVRLLVLVRVSRRDLADRVPAEGPLRAEFHAQCARLGVRPPVLSVSPSLAGPISLPNGEIVVPSWACESLDPRRRRAMLAHELAHQVRHDPRWLALALGLEGLFWLQPLHGLARRRLTHLSELQADSWGAHAVNDPRALVECLVECVERFQAGPAVRFGAGMSRGSLLLERVDRLTAEQTARVQGITWALRAGVALSLALTALLAPGCGPESPRRAGHRVQTRVTLNDGSSPEVSVSRHGYSLEMESTGRMTFADDESDLATLASGREFSMKETFDGEKTEYLVRSDRDGNLVRTWTRDGVARPLDDAGRRWLAAALPRMFRESGLDAEARVARLLARGGPALVLAEVDSAVTDYSKANYLRILLRTGTLDAAGIAGAVAASAGISSDFDRAEVLVALAPRLPDDAGVRSDWLAAAAQIHSDHDLGRTIQAGLGRPDAGERFAASLIELAARRLGSDFELRTVLESISRRASNPSLASAYLAAVHELDSDFDRRSALVSLLREAKLDHAGMGSALDATATMKSDFEKRTVLRALAKDVAGDPELARHYREVARALADFERGEALRALDDATGI